MLFLSVTTQAVQPFTSFSAGINRPELMGRKDARARVSIHHHPLTRPTPVIGGS